MRRVPDGTHLSSLGLREQELCLCTGGAYRVARGEPHPAADEPNPHLSQYAPSKGTGLDLLNLFHTDRLEDVLEPFTTCSGSKLNQTRPENQAPASTLGLRWKE